MVDDAFVNASCSSRKGKEPIVMTIDVTAHLDPYDLGFHDATRGSYFNPFEDDIDFDKYELGFDDGMSAAGTNL